ncbi:putative ferredoxin-like protein YdhY [Clostridia bacterium]|nr:putative ferredoxin-like protein YdhY [Clostridia bacterium]
MSEEKMGVLSREYTRRQFMKLTAKGLTGVALSSSLLALMGVTRSQAESGQVQVLATPDYLLVANLAKCTGCQRCEANCTLANDGDIHPFMSRLHVRDNVNFGPEGATDNFATGGGAFGEWAMAPDTCKQCKDPACLTSCPVQAIYVSEINGARVIDQAKCVGCGICRTVCPWDMPRLDTETRKSTKCVNCGACVRGCPTSALTLVDWYEVAKAL